ncbi:hypothetical protein BU23DRAFT_472110 [Bimuria novae-zelandiae CBS 107.79]|uniref:Xylanolytic transcriptional activator regulatory domain-containing protein n=1 Tax=Bimuria novae-zelandiae CBS 107.79 TaxID=1447943 RepID=A0A6A5V4U7_9PLEO|nr:hypothetical protein BU23DRAFT_472110 [Bimuria novae-zelandiae CBS 107.79]
MRSLYPTRYVPHQFHPNSAPRHSPSNPGIPDRCFYHPAPLTKRNTDDNAPGRSKETPDDLRPPKRKRTSKFLPRPDAPSFSFHERFTDAVPMTTNQPGYLGPTSYSANLPQDEVNAFVPDREASMASEGSDYEMAHQHPLTKSMRVQMATEVLKCLRYYPLLQELIGLLQQYAQTCVVPLPLEIDLINGLGSIVDRFNLVHSVPDPRLVAKVLDNSSRPLDIPDGLKARDFHQLCTGDNIRLEVLGFVFATAGRAISFGLANYHFTDPANPNSKSRLIDELLRASTTCTILCTLISPVNHITVWMWYENYMFTVMMSGFSGAPSWRRFGELASQLYALGLHREPTAPNVPTWLLETRRRVFSTCFLQDKTLSTFLGRPIRLSKRHADMKLPLDLDDSDIVADEATLSRAIAALDEHGWNTERRYLRTSWSRMRCISATYREEILDVALSKLDSDVERQLLDISRRIRESWDAFPEHLRYWPNCWNEKITPYICLMMVIAHQTHWYNEFIIRKLLDQGQTPITSNLELLRVSTSLLSTTLTLGTIRDRLYDIHKEFLIEVILCGIPSASVLATALQEQYRTNAPFPPGISRPETIRMLSVLISHLDAAAHLDSSSAGPGEANYNLCKKASKAFTKIVDHVLEPRAEQVTPCTTDTDLDLNLDLFSAPGLEAFEGMEFVAGDDANIDWGAMTQWTL